MKVVKVILNEKDKKHWESLACSLEDGCFCKECDCGDVSCSECPVKPLNDMARELRIAVFDFLNKEEG